MTRKSILVVDDEKSQREILEMILSGEGYDVTTASSGEAAIKFAKDRRFDLALITLPFPADRLVVTPLFEEELLIVQHSETPSQAWKVGVIKPEQLDDAPFLLYPKRSNMRSIIGGRSKTLMRCVAPFAIQFRRGSGRID